MNLLVLSDPGAKELQMLSQIQGLAEISIAGSLEEARQPASVAEAILLWEAPDCLLEETLPLCPSLRWIHSKSAGIEGILTPRLASSDVVLTNARGVYARSLAEFAISGMLFFAKDLPRMNRNKADKRWEQYDVEELSGRTLAIFGYGAIGKECARLAKAFGMKIVAARRNPQKSDGEGDLDAVYSFEERGKIIPDADYLLVTSALTPETRGALGRKELAALRKNAVVVNLGRGPVIDEAALIEVLREGKIRGAVLDVFDTEPLPNSHPLWTIPNVLLSPHSADHTATWKAESMEMFLKNFQRYRAGEPLLNVCDKKLGY